jgi:acetyltransferase-like isoleucine patch superfamily enzyme
VSLPYKLAKIANSNLVIGNHVSIQSSKIDLRSRVEICSYAIIGAEVEILTASHNVDSVDWEMKCYGITIGEYAWLATRTLILPSCQTIGRGAVCAAGSVVCSDVEPMAIVSGNPAKKIRNRNKIHSELCVESLLGNDFEKYVMTYIDKTKARK